MEGGHELPVGVKGQLPHPGVMGPVKGLVHADAVAHHHQSHLGGVADAGSGLRVGGSVAGQEGGLEQQALHIIDQVQVISLQQGAVGIDFLRGHLVLGQGARLVGADHRHGPQALHRLEVLHDGGLPGHLLGAQGQDDGDDGAQGLWNGGYGQGHSEHQGVQNGHLPVEGEAEDQGADHQDDGGQLLAEVVQGLLKGGLALLGLVHEGGHLAQLGVHAGAGNDDLRPAVGHQGAGEDHVLPVAQGHLLPGDDLGSLLHPLALAGEGALVDLQGEVFQDAAVGHHHVASLQLHKVAGNDLGGGHHGADPIPYHLGCGGGHGL